MRSMPNMARVRRAAAVAVEQEMKAKTQEMRAKVVEAESLVPQAMADAFRSGNLGIMDYVRMKNVQADTTMREANDRGYECLVLSDCVGSYFPEFQRVGLAMIAAQGGIFGWVSHSNNRSSRAGKYIQGNPASSVRVTICKVRLSPVRR